MWGQPRPSTGLERPELEDQALRERRYCQLLGGVRNSVTARRNRKTRPRRREQQRHEHDLYRGHARASATPHHGVSPILATGIVWEVSKAFVTSAGETPRRGSVACVARNAPVPASRTAMSRARPMRCGTPRTWRRRRPRPGRSSGSSPTAGHSNVHCVPDEPKSMGSSRGSSSSRSAFRSVPRPSVCGRYRNPCSSHVTVPWLQQFECTRAKHEALHDCGCLALCFARRRRATESSV